MSLVESPIVNSFVVHQVANREFSCSILVANPENEKSKHFVSKAFHYGGFAWKLYVIVKFGETIAIDAFIYLDSIRSQTRGSSVYVNALMSFKSGNGKSFESYEIDRNLDRQTPNTGFVDMLEFVNTVENRETPLVCKIKFFATDLKGG